MTATKQHPVGSRELSTREMRAVLREQLVASCSRAVAEFTIEAWASAALFAYTGVWWDTRRIFGR